MLPFKRKGCSVIKIWRRLEEAAAAQRWGKDSSIAIYRFVCNYFSLTKRLSYQNANDEKLLLSLVLKWARRERTWLPKSSHRCKGPEIAQRPTLPFNDSQAYPN
jgi:hypothetical protein